MQKVFFKTFGCRTNIYDTQIMMGNLKDFIIVQNEDEADFIVVNSCTVTNSADGSARSYINSVKRKDKKVILAGCGAFSKGDELYEQEKVFGVFGHSEKANINQLLKSDTPFFQLGDLESIDDTIVEDFSAKTKAFIKIQEGCDFRCSYCIIPYVRGNARSQNENKILEQITKLADNGFGEFVLTGTNIGSYGKDKNSSIATLLKKYWLEKHLHIALQHTNENMLRIMRRRNALNRDLELFEKISDKGFALGTDFIVGHPGESEGIWQDGLENFKRFPITHLHAFSYSDRSGTHASSLKDKVRGDRAKERLKVLEEIVNESNFKFRQRQKENLLILVEEKKGEFQAGYDQFYNKINIKSDKNLQKEWVSISEYEVKKEGNFAILE